MGTDYLQVARSALVSSGAARHVVDYFDSNVEKAAAVRSRPPPCTFTELRRMSLKRVPYQAVSDTQPLKMMRSLNCHSGQAKLTAALLRALSLSVGAGDGSGWHLVYAGASGTAAGVAAVAYPKLRMTLFDPSPDLMQLLPGWFRSKASVASTLPPAAAAATLAPQWMVVTAPAAGPRKPRREGAGRAEGPQDGLFTDGLASGGIRARLAPSERLLFVSDIRADAGDRDIAEDMLQQQRWVRAMAPDAFMLKFRCPYITQAHNPLEEYALAWGSRPREGRLAYLPGTLHLQQFAPVSSLELRLMGDSADARATRPAQYDVALIEETMAAFNLFVRPLSRFRVGAGPALYDYAAVSQLACALPEPTAERVRGDIRRLMRLSRKQDAAECMMGNPSGKHDAAAYRAFSEGWLAALRADGIDDGWGAPCPGAKAPARPRAPPAPPAPPAAPPAPATSSGAAAAAPAARSRRRSRGAPSPPAAGSRPGPRRREHAERAAPGAGRASSAGRAGQDGSGRKRG